MDQGIKRFDPQNPKYYCCCGCHIMSGAKLVALYYTVTTYIGAIAFIATLCIYGLSALDYFVKSAAFDVAVGMILGYLLSALFITLLWYGLLKEREGFLIPILVLEIISLIFLGSYTIIGLIKTLFALNHGGSAWFALFFIIPGGLFGLECWFFTILKGAYHYIQEKRCLSTTCVIDIHQMEQAYMATLERYEPPYANGKELTT